jgi:tetratricopeptide (TPR) repeat protein
VFKDENAQNLSKNYAFAHMQLALHYRRTKDFPKAVAEMERVQRMFPDWVEIQLPLGSIYLTMGDTLKAWSFYNQLAERVPATPRRSTTGRSARLPGQAHEAIDAFRRSRTLDPNYPNPYFDEFATLWDRAAPRGDPDDAALGGPAPRGPGGAGAPAGSAAPRRTRRPAGRHALSDARTAMRRDAS